MTPKRLIRRLLGRRDDDDQRVESAYGKLPRLEIPAGSSPCIPEPVEIDGTPAVRWQFMSDPPGKACLARASLAQSVFADRPWLAPTLAEGKRWLATASYPHEARLDRLAADADEKTRLRIADQLADALFEIFMEGFAHRDLRASKLYFLDGQLILSGFELMEPYPPGGRPAFAVSCDLAGRGLPSVGQGPAMYYAAERPEAVAVALRVRPERLVERVAGQLAEALRTASVSFHGRKRRKVPKAGRVYGSFSLPYLSVGADEAQRDSARRFERFGVEADDLGGKRVLDLGSHTGAMLFAAQRFAPARCLGVEYDTEKVRTANRIAGLNGLSNVRFVSRDLDRLAAGELDGPFDVVFCLAIEAHVKRKAHLYGLIAASGASVVYFEGNSSTDADEAAARLKDAGFEQVEHRGVCDDDCLPANNCRPLLVACRVGSASQLGE